MHSVLRTTLGVEGGGKINFSISKFKMVSKWSIKYIILYLKMKQIKDLFSRHVAYWIWC